LRQGGKLLLEEGKPLPFTGLGREDVGTGHADLEFERRPSEASRANPRFSLASVPPGSWSARVAAYCPNPSAIEPAAAGQLRRAAQRIRMAEQLEVLIARQPLIDLRFLRTVPQPSGHANGTRVRGKGADQDLHQRVLPGPVLPYQADDLARVQSEVNTPQYRAPAARRPHPAAIGLLDT
jgi:hypothetical protein